MIDGFGAQAQARHHSCHQWQVSAGLICPQGMETCSRFGNAEALSHSRLISGII